MRTAIMAVRGTLVKQVLDPDRQIMPAAAGLPERRAAESTCH
jgi:hypothetical protein